MGKYLKIAEFLVCYLKPVRKRKIFNDNFANNETFNIVCYISKF